MKTRLILGDCLAKLRKLEAGSVDAIVTDPPYPEIDRPYGRMSEAQWDAMMRRLIPECRRVLKPTGSAVFILQPNSRKVGSMRPWLWEFMAWTAREWNQVQDAYWWNFAALPTVHSNRARGLMRPSVKACVWLGAPDCYRNQNDVLWTQSLANAAQDRSDRALRYNLSGVHKRPGRMAGVSDERGGVTPFNLIPAANTNSTDSAGSNGHPAGTPSAVADWWIRYITRPGDTVLDMFSGSGTMGIASVALGRSYIGIERDPGYHATGRRLIAAAVRAAARTCPA